MDEHFSPRRKGALRHTHLSNQSLDAGDDFIAPRFQSDGHQEGRDESQGNADRQGGEKRTRISGMGASTSSSPPKVSRTMPP